MADPQNTAAPQMDFSDAAVPKTAASTDGGPTPQAQSAPVGFSDAAVPKDTSVLSNHPTLQKLDRGLKLGTAKGFGLNPDDEGNIGFYDMAGQTLQSLKKSAIDSFHHLGGTDDTPAPGSPEAAAHPLTGPKNALVALATPFDMAGTGIDGMATGIETASKKLLAGIKNKDHQQIGEGLGHMLATLGQLGLGVEGSAASDVLGKVGDVTEGVGKSVEKNATRPANGLVRAKTAQSFRYGKNPGQTIIDEQIKPTNDLDNLRGQIENSQKNIDTQLRQVLTDPAVAHRTINPLQIVDQKLGEVKAKLASDAGLQNRAGVINALNEVRKDIAFQFDSEGTPIGIKSGARTLTEATDMRKAIDRSTRFNADPELFAYVNEFRKGARGAINDAIETEVQKAAKTTTSPLVQSVKDLNRRYSNSIEFQRLLEDRITKEGNADVGFANAVKHGEYWSAMTGLLGGAGLVGEGHPMAGAGAIAAGASFLANRAARSPAGRVIRARGGAALGKGLQAAGQAAQGAIPQAVASEVGQGAAVAATSASAPPAQGMVRIQAADGSIHDIPSDNMPAARRLDPNLKIINPGQ